MKGFNRSKSMHVHSEPIPDKPRVKKQKNSQICQVTKQPHDFKISDRRRYRWRPSIWYLEYRCKDCNKKKVKTKSTVV